MSTQCCFCDLDVLGLAGLDAALQPYFLKQEESDELVRQAGIVGAAHGCCLSADPSAEFWHQRKVENLVNTRQMKVLHQTAKSFVAINPRTRSLAVMRSGTLFWVDAIEIEFDGDVPVAYQLRQDLTFNISSDASLIRRVSLAMNEARPIPLQSLLDSVFGFSVPTSYTDIAAAGIRPFEDDPDCSFYALEQGFLSGQIDYKLTASNCERNAITANLRHLCM